MKKNMLKLFSQVCHRRKYLRLFSSIKKVIKRGAFGNSMYSNYKVRSRKRKLILDEVRG